MILFAMLMLFADPHPAAPIGDPGQWVTADDYPPAALANGTEGVSVIRFDVAANGAASNCRTDTTSGSAELDTAACTAVMGRARFTPATDARGRAIASSLTRRIRWQVPDDMRPPELGRLMLTRGANGRITNCSLQGASRSIDLRTDFCEAVTVAAPGAPPVASGALTLPMPPADAGEGGQSDAPPEIGRLMIERGSNGRITRCYAQGASRTAPLEIPFCEALTVTAPGAPPVASGSMTIAMPGR